MINIIFICWLIYFLYWTVSSLFVKKAVIKKKTWGVIGILRIFVLAFIVFIIITNWHSSNLVNFKSGSAIFKDTFPLHIIGSIITIGGLLGALWSRTILGRNWSGYVTYKENHELVTTGPYRFVRHPIYSSILLMLLGTFLYSGLSFVLAMFIIIIFIFLARMKKEEKIMIELFGETYEDYIKKTYALIPGIY